MTCEGRFGREGDWGVINRCHPFSHLARPMNLTRFKFISMSFFIVDSHPPQPPSSSPPATYANSLNMKLSPFTLLVAFAVSVNGIERSSISIEVSKICDDAERAEDELQEAK